MAQIPLALPADIDAEAAVRLAADNTLSGRITTAQSKADLAAVATATTAALSSKASQGSLDALAAATVKKVNGQVPNGQGEVTITVGAGASDGPGSSSRPHTDGAVARNPDYYRNCWLLASLTPRPTNALARDIIWLSAAA